MSRFVAPLLVKSSLPLMANRRLSCASWAVFCSYASTSGKMPQANKSHGDEFDNVVVAVESEEENFSVGPGVQGYYKPPRREPAYYQNPNNNYDSDDDGWCFQADTRVQLCDGREVAIKELKPGDSVKVVKKDGRIAYSPFIAMLHREPDKTATFRQIYAEGKKGPVSLTPNHLIYATKNPQENIGRPVLAKEVEEGMYVFLAGDESKKVTPANVEKVQEVELCGFFAPLTTEGTIMAEGVAASCYADFDHELSHKAFGPLRLLYGLKSALGVGEKRKKVAKVGVHWYAKALMKSNMFLFHVQPAIGV